MRLYKVRGGVDVAHHKVGADQPLEELAAPPVVTVPLLQHRGAPGLPLVKRGDVVRWGQRIGDPKGLGSPVHSPVSGKVTAVGQRLHPSGSYVESIVIENDGTDERIDAPTSIDDPTALSPEETVQRVQAAGIVGMGGAMFPTAVKLTPSQPVDTLIVNGCECEPFLTCDHRIMLECVDDLVFGWEAVRHAVGAERVLVAIEANKPDAIAVMRQAVSGRPQTEVVVVPTRYPQGAEGVLIRQLTGHRLRSRGLPFEVGCLVQNVATLVAIARTLRYGEPLIRRPMTVAGSAVSRAANVWARIGSSAEFVLDQVGRQGELRQLIIGGPMMGQSAPSLDIPVIKGMSALLALTPAEVLDFTTGVCVRCGSCLDVCPEGLVPFHLARLAEAERWIEADQAGTMNCIECASCTYICPGRRPLVQLIRLAKGEILREQAAARSKAQNMGGTA